MLTLAEVVDLVHGWYPPSNAADWDAVGLIYGDLDRPVSKVMLAVDPVQEIANEAIEWGADLLIVHHPLFLKAVHGFSTATPKGRVLATLVEGKVALLAAHTNADVAIDGTADAMARALGLTNVRPLEPLLSDTSIGIGRVGDIEAMSVLDLAERLSEVLPITTPGAIKLTGSRRREVRRVALCPGAGDSLLGEALASGADVYVTSDLRHHLVSEQLEAGGQVIDIPHWSAEWLWLPVLEAKLRAALGDSIETRVSEIVTDPWTSRI